MIKAASLKRGMILSIDNKIYSVTKVLVKTPSSRGANTLYKTKMKEIQTGLNREESFRGEDQVEELDITRKDAQYSYDEGDSIVFMDSVDFEQYSILKADIEDEIMWLYEGLDEIKLLIYEEAIVGIELPTTVTLEIMETAPEMKSASASARTKPATLSTGAVVQVPEYLAIGEMIKVNTENGKYISRG